MSRFRESLAIAAANLAANPVRSLLSALGVVIGAGAVVAILSISGGVQRVVMESVNALDGEAYEIRPAAGERRGRFVLLQTRDVERIKELPFVLAAQPQINLHQEVRGRHGAAEAAIRGVDERYLAARNLTLTAGSNFSPVETENRAFVCLVNQAVAERLFPGRRAEGETLYFFSRPWTVIGVFDRPGRRAPAGREPLEVLCPVSSLLRTSGFTVMAAIEAYVRRDAPDDASARILAAVERGDPARRGLYQVYSRRQALEQRMKIQRNLSLFVALVAAVSLLVGGIGLMNVMLTSVAERTREIGLRRAIGARQRDILLQFLVESATLSGLGGALGLFLGVAGAHGFFYAMRDRMEGQPDLPLIAFLAAAGASILFGVLAGLYPAVKAAHLPPAEALRTE